jgi:hypothetical protein
MELRAYWRIILRRWWLVLLPPLAVVAYTLLTYAKPPTIFQAHMNFAAGAVSQRLAEKGVLMPDGSPIPSGAIQGAIASDNAQSLFVIYVSWGDPDTLLAIADAITVELTQNAGTYYPQLADLPVAPARRVDQPIPVAVPPSLRNQLTGPAVRVALGFAIGLALAFLWHYLDPTVRERAELEALGYVVLAEIPRRSPWPF